MRRLALMLLALMLLAQALLGCTPPAGVRVLTPGPVRPLATPRVTPVAAPTPLANPRQTKKPKPTPAPARLTWSRITYPPNACWNADYRDSEGHETGGVKVTLSFKVTNRGDLPSDPVWVTIESTGILGGGTTPSWTSWSPGKGNVWSLNDNGLLFRGPPVKGGETVRIKFGVVFHTTFDVRYDIHASTAQTKEQMMADRAASRFLQMWSVWTKSKFCW